jgi:hypothetical protein
MLDSIHITIIIGEDIVKLICTTIAFVVTCYTSAKILNTMKGKQ